MIVATSLKNLPEGTSLYGRTNSQHGDNRDPGKSDVLFTFDIIANKFLEKRSVFQTKKELMEEVLIPAFHKAGSRNPKAMATQAYGWWLKGGKLIEVEKTKQRRGYPSYI
jgi:hypothetical protein